MVAFSGAPGLAATRSPSALTGPEVFGWGFNSPDSVSSDGTHVWVANYLGDSVTELDASTGALVQVISASSYGFAAPLAVSSDGQDVWVTNPGDQSVTAFPAA